MRYVTSSGTHNTPLKPYAMATNIAIVAPIFIASPITQLAMVSAPLFALKRAANNALGTQQIAQDGAEPGLQPRIDARGGGGDLTAAARHHRIFDDRPGAFAFGGRQVLAHHGGIFGMQMHAYIASRDRQCGNRFANDSNYLRRIGFELAAHDLPRQSHGQGQEFALHLRIQDFERLGQVVKHPGQTFDLCANFRTAGLATLGEPLLEGLLVRLCLQVGESAYGSHLLRGNRAPYIGSRPHPGAGSG